MSNLDTSPTGGEPLKTDRRTLLKTMAITAIAPSMIDGGVTFRQLPPASPEAVKVECIAIAAFGADQYGLAYLEATPLFRFMFRPEQEQIHLAHPTIEVTPGTEMAWRVMFNDMQATEPLPELPRLKKQRLGERPLAEKFRRLFG